MSNVAVVDATGRVWAGEGGEGDGENDEGLGEEHVDGVSGEGREGEEGLGGLLKRGRERLIYR